MIGCEIRSYGRVGLGYLTGIVGLIGFYLGYLPYVYLQESIDGFIADYTFLRATNIPELLASAPHGPEAGRVVLYTLALLGLFVLIVVQGAKRLGATPKEYLTLSTGRPGLTQSRLGVRVYPCSPVRGKRKTLPDQLEMS